MVTVIQFPVEKTIPALEDEEGCQEMLGSLDEELFVARLQLSRALKAERKDMEADAVGDERTPLKLVELRIAETGKQRAIYRRTDWHGVVDRLIGRIADLESKQAKWRRREIDGFDEQPIKHRVANDWRWESLEEPEKYGCRAP
jgi:hypothetical protein